jgi:release factor glutamine methyltransferase
VDNSLSSTAQGAGNVADSSIAALLAFAQARGVGRLDAEVLLSSLCGKNRAFLLAFGDTQPGAMTAALFGACIERRLQGEPVAYITGIREFWSLPLVVTPAVLVPRPETELLVELCLTRLGTEPCDVADLGTGSGAIALALAHERPNWRVLATDFSASALAIATANRERLHLANVRFAEGSWLGALPDQTGNRRFDAIVSNPPYVEAQDAALAALAHEPQSALIAADSGYADLITIARDARRHLKSGGLLLLEHGASQAERLGRELTALGYENIACHPDLAGLDRVTEARGSQTDWL